jgi:hypothetical protein
MLASLKNIEANIGGLTNLIIRTNGFDASAAGIQIGTKTTGILGGLTSALTGVSNFVGGKTGSMIGAGIGLAIAGPIGAAIGFLGAKLLGGLGKVLGSVVNALFGTKTSIVGQGIYGGAQSLGSILSGGFDASYYTDIKKTKKFFGISVGSSYSTQYAASSSSALSFRASMTPSRLPPGPWVCHWMRCSRGSLALSSTSARSISKALPASRSRRS